MIDNSPYCVNGDINGVMLPFYGSSSFVNESILADENGMLIGTSGEQEGVKKLCEMIRKEEISEKMVMKIEELGENWELFSYVM